MSQVRNQEEEEEEEKDHETQGPLTRTRLVARENEPNRPHSLRIQAQASASMAPSKFLPVPSSSKRHLAQTMESAALLRQSVMNNQTLIQQTMLERFLRDIETLLRRFGVASEVTVFISYAWEEDLEALKQLQTFLRKVSHDLGLIGVTVHVDIEGINFHMPSWMKGKIDESDFILLIGTPRYKTKSIQQTNVRLEYDHITAKLRALPPNAEILIPLLFSGDYTSSFPNGILEHMIRDFSRDDMETYCKLLTGLVDPIGVIPSLFKQFRRDGPCSLEYARYAELLVMQLDHTGTNGDRLDTGGLPNIQDRLPPTSQDFVGREEEFKRLDAYFKKTGQTVMILQGSGGTGKSQLATEFAHRTKFKRDSYALIRWLKADSVETLRNSYLELGSDLGIEPDQAQSLSEAQMKTEIERRLLAYRRVLLIYDNVEDIAHVEAFQPSSGGSARIHVLITTRNRFVNYPVIEVKEFTGMEIQTYLSKRFQREIALDQAERLGSQLSNLPLAIVQAAAYMINYATSLSTFLLELQAQGPRDELLRTKLKPILMLWDLTLKRLSPEALHMIQVCSFLDPDTIPRVLLLRLVGNSIKARDVLFELRGQFLLLETGSFQEDEDKVVHRIHRLLQEAIRHELDDNKGKVLVEKAVEVLIETLGSHELVVRNELFMFWKQKGFFIAQVNRLLVEAKHIDLAPLTIANLLDYQGEYQLSMNRNWSFAEKLFEESLDIRTSCLEGNHPLLACSFVNLGSCHIEQRRTDKYQLALGLFQKAYAIRMEKYGEDHPVTATSIRSLGEIYFYLQEYTAQLEWEEKYFNIQKSLVGENHPSMVDALLGLGRVHGSLGHYHESITYFEQALELARNQLSQDNPTIGTLLMNIGVDFRELGNLDKALEFNKQAVEFFEKAGLENHPTYALALVNAGGLYEKMGKLDDSVDSYQQALAVRRKLYGETHADVANSLEWIGEVYKKMEKFDDSLDYYQQSLAVRRKLYGETHADVANSLEWIGEVYKRMEKFDVSLDYYQQSLAVRRKLYGETHADVANCLVWIGEVYKKMEKFDDSLDYYQQALAVRRKLYGETHADVANCLVWIGEVYKKVEKFDESLDYYQQALAVRKKLYGETHADVANCFEWIGEVYKKMAKFDDSLDYFQQALAVRRKLYGETHADIARSLYDIGLLHLEKHELAKAIAVFDDALVVNKAVFGERHENVGVNYGLLAESYESAGELQKALEYFELSSSTFMVTNDVKWLAFNEQAITRIRSKLVENMHGVSSVEESDDITGSNVPSIPIIEEPHISAVALPMTLVVRSPQKRRRRIGGLKCVIS